MSIYPFNANPCRRCSRPIGDRPASAWYCWDCTTGPKKGSPTGRRAADIEERRPLIVGGRRVCKDCQTPLQKTNKSGPPPARCDKCTAVRLHIKQTIQSRAVRAVNYAVRKGRLPRVSTLACVDCGLKADVYEHRDYGKPLQVEPVCHSCNRLRGPAVFPHPYCAYGAKPATPCQLCEGTYSAAAIRRAHACRCAICLTPDRVGIQSTRAA